MSHQPLRFIHAGDFHLEAPLSGVSEVPGHLRDTFIDAPYQAAERVFDAVLSQDAQFLILSGDLLDPHAAGARGVLFLIDQFERLAGNDIPVYWVGGAVDAPDAWPTSAALPDNVHVFPRGRPTETVYVQEDRTRARICGASRGGQSAIRPAEFITVDDGMFSIAVAYGQADEGALTQQTIDYWALGGRHRRRTLATAPVAVHYAGSTQGRTPSETGPHGCTLAEVDETRRVRTSLIATDVLRWQHERLVIDADTDRRKLEQSMRERVQRLIDGAGERHLLVSWTLAGNARLISELRRGRLAAEILSRLRTEFGQQTAAVWSVGLDVEAPGAFPTAWYDEDTMLGEFLRNAQTLQTDASIGIDLKRFLGRDHAGTDLAGAVEIRDASVRQEVLRQAAVLGVDLLKGGDFDKRADRDLGLV